MNREIKYVTAIDIGTTKIVSIVGRKNGDGRLEILGISKTSSKGVKRGVVLNIEETANAIQAIVKKAQDKSDIKFSDVFVGIAGQHIKSIKNRGYRYINSDVGEITQDVIDALTEDMYKIPIQAGEEIIHVIPQNYIVDNETGVKQPVGMSGRRVDADFHIVIGRIASAMNIKKCINRAGLDVNRLILEPLASAEAVLTEDEKEAGVALVDIGGGTTDIAVFYDGIIRHTAVIPFGGNVVTNDIKEGCSILQRQAEALKIQYGSALSDMAPENKVVTIPGISGRDSKEISFKSLACIIQARMEEIIDAIYFEIENSGFIEKLGAGIVITGGGASLKHLTQLIKFKTGLDVRIGLPSRNFAATVDKEVNKAMYSTSVGLLLKGYEYLENNQVELKEKEESKPVEDNLTDEEENEEQREEKKERDGLFSAFKKTITEIFEEKDTKM